MPHSTFDDLPNGRSKNSILEVVLFYFFPLGFIPAFLRSLLFGFSCHFKFSSYYGQGDKPQLHILKPIPRTRTGMPRTVSDPGLSVKIDRLQISIREVKKIGRFLRVESKKVEKIPSGRIIAETIIRKNLMHRQSGRHLKTEYYLEIECLPDEQLFSPSEIVKRKFDKRTQLECFNRMFHSIYQFGVRNGLALHPDNGKRLPGGKQVMTDEGRAELKPGERRAKWLGKTWKSKLYIEDREEIERYAKVRLVETLRGCLAQKRREEDDMRKPRRKLGLRKGLWVAALVAAIVLTAGSLYNYSFLQDGYAILRSQGPKAALEFFQNRGETYDNLFGQAWAAYRNGQYEEAEKQALRVLKSGNTKDQARASYLLGDLNTIKGDYLSAREYLLTAHAIYESLGKANSLFRTELFLAKMYLYQKDLENAEYYTNLAAANPIAESNHVYLFIKSQVAFLKHDYDQALAFSLMRERVANGDLSQLAGIYSDIGFYHGLTGNPSECLVYTNKAEGLAFEQENMLLLMYNNINMCLYLKCTMQDFSSLMDTVLTYARDHKDTKLMEQMYFVEKFSCPLPQTDPGHGDPPDDPDEPPPTAPATRMTEDGIQNRKQ